MPSHISSVILTSWNVFEFYLLFFYTACGLAGEISLVPLQKLNFPYLNSVCSIWQIYCFIKLLKDTDKAHNYES